MLEEAGAEPHAEDELRLMMAATAGDAERVDELLAAGASPDARAIDGRSAIVAATQIGQAEIVARLIAAGCDVDLYTPGEGSALEIAVRQADAGLTRQLLDGGANVVMLAATASRAITAAENAGAPEVAQMIRDALPPQLSDIDRQVEAEIAANHLYWSSQDDLPRQASFGDLEKVDELLAVDGVELDGFDPLRRTPLSAAAEAGQLEMVRELISRGADVNKCNEVEGSPRSTPLVCAAISGSADRDQILQLLIKAGADLDQVGADGRTALSHAVERDVGFFGRAGEFALSTRTLIEAGADLEIRDRYGLTAWMRAASLGSSIELDEVAERYEELADLVADARASREGMPEIELIWAVWARKSDEVRDLLTKGVNPDTRRHDGSTALMLAVRDGLRNIIDLLIEAGCNLDARQWVDRGPRAIDAAVSDRNRPLVQLLLRAGASPPAREIYEMETFRV